MVEKGDGGSFRGELGLRGLARFSLSHSDEGAPGGLVQECAVGEVHLRVTGESHELTLKMRWCYARTLYRDANATLDDLREAVTTLEDAERITRRVFGGAHPLTQMIERDLFVAREVMRGDQSVGGGSGKRSVRR